MTRYFRESRREVFLDDATVGQGGEAVVKRGYADPLRQYTDGYVYKLWRDGPNVPLLRMKAAWFIQNASQFPTSVIGPRELLYDDRGVVVGYSMISLPEGHISLDSLTSSGTWKGNNLSHVDVVQVLLVLHDLLTFLHPKGMRVGDLNPTNFSFVRNRAFFAYDTDAWHFADSLPCATTNVEYMSPLLYGQSLAQFLPQHDWWPFALVAFQALTRIHPFLPEGLSDTPATVPNRVRAGQHVLSTLEYLPTRFAFPPKVLPNRTLALFKSIFDAKGQGLTIFPRAELEWLQGQFVTCPNHKIGPTYARERTACPVCAEDISVPSLAPPKPAQVQLSVLSTPSVPQRVVFSQTALHNSGSGEHEHLLLLTTDGAQKLFAHWIDPLTGRREQYAFETYSDYQVYDVNPRYIIVAEGNGVFLYSHTGQDVCDFTTETYRTEGGIVPVVGLNSHNPVYVHQGELVTGDIRGDTVVPKDFLMPLTQGKTWLKTSTSGLVVGFVDTETALRWFMYQSGTLRYLPLPQGQGEDLEEAYVAIRGNWFAIFRRMQTQQGQRIYLSLFEGGEEKPTYNVAVPEFGDLEKSALTPEGTMWLPTKMGILRLKKGEKATILPGPGSQRAYGNKLTMVDNKLYVTSRNASVYRVTG